MGFPEKIEESKKQHYQKVSDYKLSNVMTKIACFAESVDDIIIIDSRLKWSRSDFGMATFIMAQKDRIENIENLSEKERLNVYLKLKTRLKMNLFGVTEIHKRVTKFDESWATQLAIYLLEPEETVDKINDFAVPTPEHIPSSASLTSNYGIGPGPALGIITNKLRREWIESLFKMGSDEFDSRVKEIKLELQEKGIIDKNGNFIKPKAQKKNKKAAKS